MTNVDTSLNESSGSQNCLSSQDLKYALSSESGSLIINKHAMRFHFHPCLALIKVTVRFTIVSEFYQNQVLPCNFISNLAKSKDGAKFLRNSKIVQELKEILLCRESTAL